MQVASLLEHQSREQTNKIDYPFGASPEAAVAALRELADAIEARAIVVEKMIENQRIADDDFSLRTWIIKFASKR